MKRTNILAALLVACRSSQRGCGTSDYVQSVTLSSTGATSGGFSISRASTARFSFKPPRTTIAARAVPVTDSVTFTVTTVGVDDEGNPLPAYGPITVPINKTGLMQAVGSLCTWTDLPSGSPPAIPTPPQYNWVLDGYYQVIASYNGMASNPVGVGVGSAAGDAPDGTCGPLSN